MATLTLTKNRESTDCTVTGAGTYSEGDTVTITASVSGIAYQFLRWIDINNETVSTDATYSFTMGTDDVTYQAIFESMWKIVTVSPNPAEGGSVTISSSEETSEGTIYKGGICHVTATPNRAEGYQLGQWVVNGIPINEAPLEVDITINTEDDTCFIVAAFSRETFLVDANSNPPASGTIEGTGVYQNMSYCTLIATPSSGYLFKQWAKEGVLIPGATSEVLVELVTGNVLYTAYFEKATSGTNKDVILTDEFGDIYPLAHSDSNGEVIPDTYQRKEVDEFVINPTLSTSIEPVSGAWVGSDGYYVYKLGPDLYPEVANVKSTDVPIWDIEVDPKNVSLVPYKTQIKYRAWCTTLLTYDGYMELIATNCPQAADPSCVDTMKLTCTGLDLEVL